MSHLRPSVAIVVGAGVAGLTAARCLQRVGYRVRVFEKRLDWTSLLDRDRGLALWPNAQRVLAYLGLAPMLEDVACFAPAPSIRWRDGRWLLHGGDTDPFAHRRLATLRRSELLSFLADPSLHPPGVEVYFGRELFHLEGGSIPGAPGNIPLKVEFLDGLVVEGDVLVAADGILSSVRRIIGQGSRRGRIEFKGRRTIEGLLDFAGDGLMDDFLSLSEKKRDTTSAASTTAEHQLEPPYQTICGDLSFSVIPISRNALSWALSFPERAVGGHFVQHPTSFGKTEIDLQDWLKKEFCKFHDPIPRILERAFSSNNGQGEAKKVNRVHSNFHMLDTEVKLNKGRVAFIGESAHALPPRLHQGTTLAIEDAWECAMCLAKLTAPKNLNMLLKKQFPFYSQEDDTTVAVDQQKNHSNLVEASCPSDHHDLLFRLQAEHVRSRYPAASSGIVQQQEQQDTASPIFNPPRWLKVRSCPQVQPSDIFAKEEENNLRVWKKGVRFSQLLSLDWRFYSPIVQKKGSCASSGVMSQSFRRVEGRQALVGRRKLLPTGLSFTEVVVNDNYLNAVAIPKWMKGTKVQMQSGWNLKSEDRYLTVENCLMEFFEIRKKRVEKCVNATYVFDNVIATREMDEIRFLLAFILPPSWSSSLYDKALFYLLGGSGFRISPPCSHFGPMPSYLVQKEQDTEAPTPPLIDAQETRRL